MGSADGTPFSSVATSLWLGAPDSADTAVVYLFSNPVSCGDLGSPGWDGRIADHTQFLEMKLFGKTPQTYTVTSSLTPAPGEASVNYTMSSRTSTPVETAGGGGTVLLASLRDATDVSGNFDLAFGANRLSGTFYAAFCPGGHEP